MRVPVSVRGIVVPAVFLLLASPSAVFATYTSTVAGATATMTGDAAGDTLSITQAGGLFHHNRFAAGDPGFNSDIDFNTSVAGDQTLASATGVINIAAGSGNDTVALGDGIDLRGAIDGGDGRDTVRVESASVWHVTAAYQGHIAGIASFSSVESLGGGTANDTFNIRAFAAPIGSEMLVSGGAGTDALNYDAEWRAVSGDLTPPSGFIESPGVNQVAFGEVETIDIVNAAPMLAIGDVTVADIEDYAVFTVTLSFASTQTVTVGFHTVDDRAISPDDFIAQTGTLTFVPGDTVETIRVRLQSDHDPDEALEEVFFVNLGSAVNAGIADAQGRGTIINNRAPRISAIADQTIAEDGTTGALPFTLSDPETAPDALTLSGVSENTTLVPTANIVFGGSGGNRTVTVTPAANQHGVARIIVRARDGHVTKEEFFRVTVTAVNDQPTITALPDRTLDANGSTGPLPFTVSDVETAAADLAVVADSSNSSLVPIANIILGGTGANRTVTVTPAADRGGVAIITVTVSDGGSSASAAFTLTVNAPPTSPNQPPTLSGLADRTIEESTSLVLTLTVGDDATPAADLVVTASSSNAALLPAWGVVLGGAGGARTLTLTPVADRTGQTTLTVTVSDGELSTTATAVLTVIAIGAPNPPTGLTASASGTDVTLTWVEATTGVPPTFYVIEGGTAPGGSTLPVIVTPSRTTHWTVPLPAGVYFFRVRAANRVGTSVASNEATVTVTSAVPLPGAPTALAATVDGVHVTVSWQPPTVGGAPDRWQLEVGSSAGASDRGVFAVPRELTSAGGELAAGEYFVRVRGVNAAGAGAASNEASFRVGEVPACDAPQAPVLLPATVVGGTITIAWQAPRPPAIANYRLVVGSSAGASNLAILDVGPVTSYVAQAPPGRYYVTLVAMNACGTSPPSNSIEAIVTGTDAPAAPVNLRATVTGHLVTLAWDAVPGATYVLEAGVASGLSNVAIVPLTTPGLGVDGVPSGTYYVRVRAVRAGVTSVPSAEIVIVVP